MTKQKQNESRVAPGANGNGNPLSMGAKNLINVLNLVLDGSHLPYIVEDLLMQLPEELQWVAVNELADALLRHHPLYMEGISGMSEEERRVIPQLKRITDTILYAFDHIGFLMERFGLDEHDAADLFLTLDCYYKNGGDDED